MKSGVAFCFMELARYEMTQQFSCVYPRPGSNLSTVGEPGPWTGAR